YYCVYCETGDESYDLCLFCFQKRYKKHKHPKSSFAVQQLTHGTKDAGTSDYLHTHKPDIATIATPEAQLYTSTRGTHTPRAPITQICAFCNDDEPTRGGGFIPYPFLLAEAEEGPNAKARKLFWVHDSCARFTPEVVVGSEGWMNITTALKRARNTRCSGCKERGATIGCFAPDCKKSYHFPCTYKSTAQFQRGLIFFCATHDETTYVDIYSCDACGARLGKDEISGECEPGTWYTCGVCHDDLFASFDLCRECFMVGAGGHGHDLDDFYQTGKVGKGSFK
ncbi:hypothetical protein HK096_003589, partial [Nowakowskiella sp. JEL0078]